MTVQDHAEVAAHDGDSQRNDITFLPPWLMQYQDKSLDELQSEVKELTISNRINSWGQGDRIAAAVIKQLAAGGKANTVYMGWEGVGRSWAITLANLARVFPPDVRTPEWMEAHQVVWYEAIYNLAKQETSLTNTRNLQPADWARLSRAAVQLANKFETKTTEEILKMVGVHKGAGATGKVTPQLAENFVDGQRRFEIPVHIDSHGHLHMKNDDGSMGQKVTVPELVRGAGLTARSAIVIIVENPEVGEGSDE